MNANTLLMHYERVSDTPDAVSRLRGFILDLAVRGRLVPQDSQDEPAQQLLGRIAEERMRLANGRSGRKPKQLPTVDDPPYELPSSWCWTRIRQITSDRGQRVPDGAFTYIDVTAIDNERGVLGHVKVLKAAEAPSRARKIVRKNDVVYSCVRPYLLNVAIIEDDIEPEAIASTAFAVLDGRRHIAPRYLWTVLRSPFMVGQVQSQMRGQAYPAINDADFAALPFPLPPLPEQHRIAAKVAELMALCDQLEAARNNREEARARLTAASLARLNAADPDPGIFQGHVSFFLRALPTLTLRAEQIKQLRQEILNLAVRGNLVRQDPNDEPSSTLLKRSVGTRSGRAWTQGLSSADPYALPSGWTWTRIANTAQRVTVGYVGPMKDQYVESGIPFIRSQNVRPNYFRREGITFISPDFHRKISKSAVKPGDVVIVRSGNVGTACVIPTSIGEANCSDVVIVQRPESALSVYLCFYLNSLASSYIEAGSVGVALTHFNTKSVATMPIPLPPLAEQHRIVAKVDQLMKVCDELEASITAADQTRRSLLEALLVEALVPSEDSLARASLSAAAFETGNQMETPLA